MALLLCLGGCNLLLPLASTGSEPGADLGVLPDAALDGPAPDRGSPWDRGGPPDGAGNDARPDKGPPPPDAPPPPPTKVTTLADPGKLLQQPSGLAFDKNLGLLVADQAANRIWRHQSGLSVFAGTGAGGYADGVASLAMFKFPSGVAIHGNIVLVADRGNDLIRRIEANLVSIYAGSGQGYNDGLPLLSKFYHPHDVAVDPTTGEVLVADEFNHCIRQATAAGVTTLAGKCTENGYQDGPAATAKFYWPTDAVPDGKGNVFVADKGNHCIRQISGGQVYTLAGTCGSQGFIQGTGQNARFDTPTGLAVDVARARLYVADLNNYCIRVVDLQTQVASTLAGECGTPAYADGDALGAARFENPWDVALDPWNNKLYVVEMSPPRLRVIVNLP